MPTVATAPVIRFTVPLPPVFVRSNSRSHWARRVKAKQEYSECVFDHWLDVCREYRNAYMLEDVPFDAARVTFTWRACHLPDQANVLGNCKALLDILCMAPKTTQTNNTTYLGLLEDDRNVEAIGKVEKVSKRVDECVVVEIVKL